jgi:NAD(P)-dependent dehydrogenase (short-subunit alcohol dehydrogenase family)
MPPLSKSIVVISGLGNAQGTGAACARLFSSALGYRVALLSRPRKDVDDLRAEIVAAGGVAEVFSLEDYNHANIAEVFQRIKAHWPDGRLKSAIWNTGELLPAHRGREGLAWMLDLLPTSGSPRA